MVKQLPLTLGWVTDVINEDVTSGTLTHGTASVRECKAPTSAVADPPSSYLLDGTPTWMPHRSLKSKSVSCLNMFFSPPAVLHLSKRHHLTSNWINPKCVCRLWLLTLLFLSCVPYCSWHSQSHRPFPTPKFLLLCELFWLLTWLSSFILYLPSMSPQRGLLTNLKRSHFPIVQFFFHSIYCYNYLWLFTKQVLFLYH